VMIFLSKKTSSLSVFLFKYSAEYDRTRAYS